MTEFSPECVAFITGAGSGIGRAVALRLVADGVKSLALIDLNEAHLADIECKIVEIDPSIEVLKIGVDCSKEDQVESAVKKTVGAFGRLDVCFNGAGIAGSSAKTADMNSENLDTVLDVNLKGVWYCERAQIRQMLKQELRSVTTGLPLKTRGSILNVASIAGSLAISTVSPYVMSKHGVLGLTKTDAKDYAADGIRVNAISPGWVKTEINRKLWESPMGNTIAARAPMARWGLPEEIAYTASFLLSDKSTFITGVSVEVDGGYSAC
ncbi:NAD(P)-binding protein [Stipitochalara longipes BDJ]|nr:NAD(P)-binding protein [Stipitochalara longipes BDJ]